MALFFSEELLLQEDSSDMSSMTTEFMMGMHLNQPFVSAESSSGVKRFKLISDASVSIQRSDYILEIYFGISKHPSLVHPCMYISPIITSWGYVHQGICW